MDSTPSIQGFELATRKKLAGEPGYEMLRYVDSSRTQMVFILHRKGVRGGEYFGGSMHSELLNAPHTLSRYWESIQSVDDFRENSEKARKSAKELFDDGVSEAETK